MTRSEDKGTWAAGHERMAGVAPMQDAQTSVLVLPQRDL